MLTRNDRRAKTRAVEKILKTRYANLRLLVDHMGSQAELARVMAWSVAYANNLAGPNPTRTISENTAREIEIKAGLSAGWMDIAR